MTSARIDSICAACKREQPIEVSQAITGQRLSWRERFECECGHGFEASGAGLPMPGVRRALVEQLGGAKVWVESAKSKPLLTKALAMVTGVTPEALTMRLEKLPAVAYEGTRVEAKFVAMALKQAGGKVRVANLRKKKTGTRRE